MKKILFLLILFLNGCRQNDARIEIEFWTLQLSPAFNAYFSKLISEYEQQHPSVKIRWVDVPYDAAIQKLLASAVADNAPDVINLSADFLAKFNGMGAFVDLNQSVQNCGYMFLPNALDLCTFDHKTVALPWYLNTYMLLYNEQLLKEAGFSDQDIPKTFEELIHFIKEYKNRTGKFALFWNIGKDSYLPMMLGSEGVEMTDARLREAAFNSPRGIALVNQWVELYKQGYLQSESIIKPGSTIVEMYQSGQVAMIFTGPVFLKRIRSNAPAIYEHTRISPAIVGVTGKHELAAMSISVLSKSRHPAEAQEFAFFVTNPVNQLVFSKMTTTYPSVMQALQDTFFRSEDGNLETEARCLGALQLSAATRLRSHLLHEEFDRLRDVFDEAVQQACLGKLSTQEALDRAAHEWNDILRNSIK